MKYTPIDSPYSYRTISIIELQHADMKIFRVSADFRFFPDPRIFFRIFFLHIFFFFFFFFFLLLLFFLIKSLP